MESAPESAVTRVQDGGFASASAVDLLALALSRSPKDVPGSEAAATKLLAQFRLPQLAHLGQGDLKHAAGLEAFEASRILAALHLGRRSAAASGGAAERIASDEDAAPWFRSLIHAEEERFGALFLDVRNQVISQRTIHVGAVESAQIGIKEVLREAVRAGASAMIVAHNHPSGLLDPSPSDIAVTRKLKDAADLLGVELLDHLIIGSSGHLSLSREGYL